MNIEQAKQEIINTVKIYTAKDENGVLRIPAVNQRPVLLIGPPGIGKTAVIRQAADICDVGLVAYTITHHTRQSAVGLPVVREKEYAGKTVSITEYTMSEIIASVYECMKQTGHENGILFIDEINCVSETLAPTMLQFLQNKTFGTHRIPEGWIIVAAGNPPEYNRAARMFDVVTMDRVKYIPVGIDFPVWKAYAVEKGLHNAIISYLSAKPQHFYYIEEAKGDREFVTARGWEDLSVLLAAYERENIEVTSEILAEYLHCRKIALDFSAYYAMFVKFRKDYDITGILNGGLDRDKLEEQKKMLASAGPDEKYSVIQLLLSGLFDSFRIYTSSVSCDQRKAEVFEELKSYLRRNADKPGYAAFDEFMENFDRALHIRREHHIISEEALHVEDQVSSYFGKCGYRLKEERISDYREASDAVEGWLKEDAVKKEKLAAKAGQELGRAFEFLEDAPAGSDGMGYFMTALSMNKDAAEYLNDHQNEGYIRNLKYLRLKDTENELRKQIADVLND